MRKHGGPFVILLADDDEEDRMFTQRTLTPGRQGAREALERIKRNPALCHFPVVVLTTSEKVIEFLRNLPEPLLHRCAQDARTVHLRADEPRCQPGSEAHEVLFIRRGCMALGMRAALGTEHILGLIGPEEVLNVLALGCDLPARENRGQALAVVDMELLAVSAEAVQTAILSDSVFALRMVDYLA